MMTICSLEKPVCVKRSEGNICQISGNLDREYDPKYLAFEPRYKEFFLLLGDEGDYVLYQGDEESGMQKCQLLEVMAKSDKYLIKFSINGRTGFISDPDDSLVCSPFYKVEESLASPIDLELLQFEVV